jgi:hypothetical protein
MSEEDKCFYDEELMKASKEILGDHWGYGFEQLEQDIQEWAKSDFVEYQSIGLSNQGRDQWELTITDFDITKRDKHRIYIHARTHPNEVQSHWVTAEIIDYLLADTESSIFFRENFVFHILPMYNPDGVELEKPRENANDIDIESNWNATIPEVEVQNLKTRFEELMSEPNSIEVALNMHSAYACKRYFVYHLAGGSSYDFTHMEQAFINAVRNYFMDGIEHYSYFTSWGSGTPTQYPESWWWLNYQEGVMALTYEDMNCSSAGMYEKTAFSILNGIADYLGYDNSLVYNNPTNLDFIIYPNPVTDRFIVEWNNFDKAEGIKVYSSLGIDVSSLCDINYQRGEASVEVNSLPKGCYIVQILINGEILTKTIVK